MNDLDGVMHALSDERRRQILIALRKEEQVHPFSGGEAEEDGAIQLHHVHLPLLEKNDLVAWNQETGTVKRGSDFEAAESILTALEARSDVLPDDYLPEEGRIC
ncbi:hypothetical protein KY092_19845 [Natronomonas gomsonensis]|uniref:hypothetical protein n=1 Tax=Natronomonas gomsonensis TaxID=1046043 RepID=UPI0020CA333D|nr:hypothetical protein [Natronomonas gomsonensis]MCY4732792.1 hypothetical protein [Natronomonas gomsonensis]